MKVGSFGRDEYMDLAKATTLKSAAVVLLGLFVLMSVAVTAQNLLSKDELAAIEHADSKNQTKLSHYTWQETQFISINGEAVDYRLYAVKIASNGQYQKSLVTEHTGQEAAFEPKAKDQLSQYGPYAQQLCELANQYTSLNSERLTQANIRGEIVLLREGDLIKMTIKDYSKPGDSLVMTINQHTHRLVTVQAKSYLTDPQDVVTIQAEFAELPDGVNHLATAEIGSVNKHIRVKLTTWSYQ
jgi:hypothetical protein